MVLRAMESMRLESRRQWDDVKTRLDGLEAMLEVVSKRLDEGAGGVSR